MDSKKRTLAFILLCTVALGAVAWASPNSTAKAQSALQAQEELQASLVASNKDLSDRIDQTNASLTKTLDALDGSLSLTADLQEEVKSLTTEVSTLKTQLAASEKKLSMFQSTFEDLGVNFP